MIRIGTSGFSYDDWKGPFYPQGIAKGDMLAYYAQYFNTVEINSSYYAIPGEAAFASMAMKTPKNFDFVVKAHKDMTHVEKPDREVFERFCESIGPLAAAGKLGCVLAQFPWSFKCNLSNHNKLREFRECMGDLPTVIEFRNADWVYADTFALLKELGFGFCCVDEPRLKGLMPPTVAATSDIGYVRFHGRNAAKWWEHEKAYERYDYLYSEEELAEWAPRVLDLESQTYKTFVAFNNHYGGQSVENARMFGGMLKIDQLLE